MLLALEQSPLWHSSQFGCRPVDWLTDINAEILLTNIGTEPQSIIQIELQLDSGPIFVYSDRDLYLGKKAAIFLPAGAEYRYSGTFTAIGEYSDFAQPSGYFPVLKAFSDHNQVGGLVVLKTAQDSLFRGIFRIGAGAQTTYADNAYESEAFTSSPTPRIEEKPE